MKVLPTGTCFDDALDFLSFRMKQDGVERAMRSLVLVHGICLVPEGHLKAGTRFAHAWVEETRPDGEVLAWQDGYAEGLRVSYAVGLLELLQELRI